MVDGILSQLGLTDEELNERLRQAVGTDFSDPTIANPLSEQIQFIAGEQQALPALPVAPIATAPQPTPAVQPQTSANLLDIGVNRILQNAVNPLPQQQPTQAPPKPSVPITGTQRTTGFLAGLSQALSGVGASIAGRDPTRAITATRKIQQEQDLIDPNSKLSRTAQENIRRIRDAQPEQFGFLTDDVIKGISAANQNLILSPLKLLKALSNKTPSLAEALKVGISLKNAKEKARANDIRVDNNIKLDRQRVFRMGNTVFQRDNQFIKDFRADKTVQSSREALVLTNIVKDLVKSGNVLARGAVSRLIGKRFNGAGVMTDRDVQDFELQFNIKAGIDSFYRSSIQAMSKGTLSEREQGIFIDLLNRMQSAAFRNITEQADLFSRQRSGFTAEDSERLRNILVPLNTVIDEDAFLKQKKFFLEGGKEPSKKETIKPVREALEIPTSVEDFIKNNTFEVVE